MEIIIKKDTPRELHVTGVQALPAAEHEQQRHGSRQPGRQAAQSRGHEPPQAGVWKFAAHNVRMLNAPLDMILGQPARCMG